MRDPALFAEMKKAKLKPAKVNNPAKVNSPEEKKESLLSGLAIWSFSGQIDLLKSKLPKRGNMESEPIDLTQHDPNYDPTDECVSSTSDSSNIITARDSKNSDREVKAQYVTLKDLLHFDSQVKGWSLEDLLNYAPVVEAQYEAEQRNLFRQYLRQRILCNEIQKGKGLQTTTTIVKEFRVFPLEIKERFRVIIPEEKDEAKEAVEAKEERGWGSNKQLNLDNFLRLWPAPAQSAASMTLPTSDFVAVLMFAIFLVSINDFFLFRSLSNSSNSSEFPSSAFESKITSCPWSESDNSTSLSIRSLVQVAQQGSATMNGSSSSTTSSTSSSSFSGTA